MRPTIKQEKNIRANTQTHYQLFSTNGLHSRDQFHYRLHANDWVFIVRRILDVRAYRNQQKIPATGVARG